MTKRATREIFEKISIFDCSQSFSEIYPHFFIKQKRRGTILASLNSQILFKVNGKRFHRYNLARRMILQIKAMRFVSCVLFDRLVFRLRYPQNPKNSDSIDRLWWWGSSATSNEQYFVIWIWICTSSKAEIGIWNPKRMNLNLTFFCLLCYFSLVRFSFNRHSRIFNFKSRARRNLFEIFFLCLHEFCIQKKILYSFQTEYKLSDEEKNMLCIRKYKISERLRRFNSFFLCDVWYFYLSKLNSNSMIPCT